MHDRLIWAYQNDPLVRGCIDSGLSLEEIIDHLAHERVRLQDKLVRLHNFLPHPLVIIKEPNGRITPADSSSPAPRECPGHEGPCDMGGVGGSQGG